MTAVPIDGGGRRRAMASRLVWPAHVGGRTFQPVRAPSRPEADADHWYRPRNDRLTPELLMKAAWRIMSQSFDGRPDGARRGLLTQHDVKVLKVMVYDFWDWSSGKLDCAYSQICSATRFSRATVARALDRLEAIGLLERMRRFKRIENDDGTVEVHQANNAYRLTMPRRLLEMVGIKPPPEPDDLRLGRLDRQMEAARRQAEDTPRRALDPETRLLAALYGLQGAVMKHEFSD